MAIMRWLFSLLLLLLPFLTQAVTVAVIDTGFDLDNEVLKPRIKLGETDEEGAIALPGFTGWSFQDNTHLKSAVLPNDVLQEVLLYRTLKAQAHQQGLNGNERAWLERKAQDKTFKENLRLFKKHAHGTLVTGILLKDAPGIEVFPVRGLGIDVPTLIVESEAIPTSPILRHSEAEFLRQIKLSEERSIQKMRKMLAWIHLHKIRVVNGSYGVSQKHILRRFAELHKEITGLDLDPIKLRDVVNGYFDSLYHRAEKILARYPDTLYIFSAGNSGQNNDENHHFPSRIRRDHLLSVAALNGDRLAHFSNWGEQHVDIAAPGVGVLSLIPSVYAQGTGLTQTPASGTSMAAPSVANLAARCLEINEKLKASDLKKLLIETGQELTELKGKILSARTVHAGRALKAAQLSREMPLDEAIKLSMSDLIATPTLPTPVSAQSKMSAPILAEDLDDPEEVNPSESSSLLPDPATKIPDTLVLPPPTSSTAPPTESAPEASPSP